MENTKKVEKKKEKQRGDAIKTEEGGRIQ